MAHKNHFLDAVLMLLGSGERQHLEFRKKVRDELVEKGFKKIIIMEENVDREYEDVSLDGKLRRIIEGSDPDLFVAFFSKDARMDGVAFELGWLCCKYYVIGIDEKIRILFDRAFDWSETTSYIPSLFVRIPIVPFDESKPYEKASIIIEKSVLNIFGRRLP